MLRPALHTPLTLAVAACLVLGAATATTAATVNGNFALPSNDWLTLANWQAHNGHGWDADSAVGGFAANCPNGSIS